MPIVVVRLRPSSPAVPFLARHHLDPAAKDAAGILIYHVPIDHFQTSPNYPFDTRYTGTFHGIPIHGFLSTHSWYDTLARR